MFGKKKEDTKKIDLQKMVEVMIVLEITKIVVGGRIEDYGKFEESISNVAKTLINLIQTYDKAN